MLVAFSVAPSGVGIRSRSGSTPTSEGDSAAGAVGDDASVHDAVAAAVRVVRDSGLPNHTDSMFTTIEGSWDDVFDVVRRATEAVAEYGSRVSLVLKADIRPGFSGELDAKVERLERALDSP
ncbi:thiamine-binding protein [Subtercola frigoramans]|uniref:Uncharacterized protein YqgV (UPF0045/DUF77 family) n=1 Tax=Subtercola frigoramans TaxID=120298 RepID=A0ABS2L461_9MICO|nr:thiamine-binding protein [Subtercola frigoramans]MBM7471862.1 uncharacterized protein YqgV (UPF0045/DUF77 family) [Subtercola frigoramans]